MEGDPPLEQVCSTNRIALSHGVAYGMTRVELDTFPHITILSRSANSEAMTKAVLLECAGAFSPRLEGRSEGSTLLCVLDIAGTQRLWGPPESVAHNLRSQFHRLCIDACVAISGNFHAAVATAKALTADNPVLVIPPGKDREALASLPLAVLNLTEQQAELFSLWGVRSLGALASLPEEELIARIGQPGKHLRQVACGECPHLFQPVEPLFSLSEKMELDSPVAVRAALLFIINTMLEQLICRASARALALASVTMRLAMDGVGSHARTIRTALPTNDRKLWLKLLHLDLETYPPQSAIAAIELEAEPGNTCKVQLELFSPQLPEPSRLDVTLARIGALVGAGNVGSAVLKDTHDPEGYRIEPFRVSNAQFAGNTGSQIRSSMRRIRPADPVLVSLRSERPIFFVFRDFRYDVVRAYGPWHNSGAWWNSQIWEHEQWDLVAHAIDGELLCCCLIRDVLRNMWRMVALYD